jgi:hypothetical protein
MRPGERLSNRLCKIPVLPERRLKQLLTAKNSPMPKPEERVEEYQATPGFSGTRFFV